TRWPRDWSSDVCSSDLDDCIPVIQLSPEGKTRRNFGAGLFVEPHQVAVDKDGNVWVADAGAKGNKGFQVTKFSPDGRVLLKLGRSEERRVGKEWRRRRL